jgi:hypothetical protein
VIIQILDAAMGTSAGLGGLWKPEEGCETHMRSLYSAWEDTYSWELFGNAVVATWSRYWQDCSAALSLVSWAKAYAILPYDQTPG